MTVVLFEGGRWEKCVTFLACIYFFPLKGTYVSFWVVVVVVANSTIGDDLGVSASGCIMIHGRFLGDFFSDFLALKRNLGALSDAMTNCELVFSKENSFFPPSPPR